MTNLMMKNFHRTASHNITDFSRFLMFYLRKRILGFSRSFEKQKNMLVKFFMMKRGRYNRPFLHITTMGVLGMGILIAPFLADTYPVLSSKASVLSANALSAKQSVEVGEDVFQTSVSQKPRDKVLDYTVQKGDTVSTVAKKFGITPDTIRWANDLGTNDALTVGDTLKILPVSGIMHKVENGDTVYTIAKKYDTEAQKIVDFPFNVFANPETFSLVDGQMIMVPDGIKPNVTEEERSAIKQQSYIAQAPATVVTSGGFVWPIHGGISQYASWYHMALDITDPIGTPIYAAENGTVTRVSVGTYDTGYGNNVWISNGAGLDSHYAHMQAVNVSVGQAVVAGQTVVGWIGMTGHTTGPHLHFEIRSNGTLVNPLSYLPAL